MTFLVNFCSIVYGFKGWLHSQDVELSINIRY